MHLFIRERLPLTCVFVYSLLQFNVYITNWGSFAGSASTPLFNKRFDSNLPSSFVNTFLIGLTSIPVSAVLGVITRVRLDMIIDYHVASTNAFSSDLIKQTIYHELSHASQYSQLGNTWYTNFVNAELNEVYGYPSGPFSPYGPGQDGNSPIIALGEAWGYHMGYFLANQKYNVENINPTKGDFQVVVQQNGYIGTDLVALENFIPNLPADPFKWIPKGLMLDLMDNGEPFPITQVNDNVSGYTIQQLFAAMQSDITTVAQYRARLVQQNPNNPTSNQISALFTSYNF